jgi:hypothetical protein
MSVTMSNGIIIENVPYGGEWRIKCDCGAALAFAYRERGTPRSVLIVTHGDGEARLEISGHSDDNLLWTLGLRDPLGDWLKHVHEYEASAPGEQVA